MLEVHSHVDQHIVRAIALQATAGLARDTPVRATGEPVMVPVGDGVLGVRQEEITAEVIELAAGAAADRR